MLRAGRMEEFVAEEAEEPWFDQRDLEQGEESSLCVWGGVVRVGYHAV